MGPADDGLCVLALRVVAADALDVLPEAATPSAEAPAWDDAAAFILAAAEEAEEAAFATVPPPPPVAAAPAFSRLVEEAAPVAAPPVAPPLLPCSGPVDC